MDQIPSKAPAGRKLKMVGKESMGVMLDQAVSRALGAEFDGLSPTQLRQLQDSVRENFQGLLNQNARIVKGVSKSKFLAEMDSSRKDLLKQRAEAEAQIAELQRQTAMLRNIHLASDGSGLSLNAKLEAQLRERFEAMCAEAGQAMRRASFPAELARVAAGTTLEQWNQLVDTQTSSATDEIDLYRRRIEKLTGALTETEEALEAMSKLKEGDPGLASIYKSVRGLQEDDMHSVQKLAMLKLLFKSNVKLQSYRQTS